jgi:hypothetical protein
MKAIKKRNASRRSSRIVIESPPLVEFTDQAIQPLFDAVASDPKPALNGAASKKLLNVQDRRYLRDIEIWLNNCVNFAERLEGREAARILRLLTEARDRAVRLRG